ncbi:hypothetical protein Pmar_PMAR023980, partial [Perkinsus marinus ATCC 50983]
MVFIDTLKEIPSIELTIDVWARSSRRSFIGVVGHYYPEVNGQLRRTLIDFIDLKGRHTRANIADSVYAALPKCNCVSKICPFTTDSASTNFRAMDLLRERMVVTFAHLGCAGHKLHLSVTNSFGLCVTESASVEDIGRSQEDIESGSNDGNDDVP